MTKGNLMKNNLFSGTVWKLSLYKWKVIFPESTLIAGICYIIQYIRLVFRICTFFQPSITLCSLILTAFPPLPTLITIWYEPLAVSVGALNIWMIYFHLGHVGGHWDLCMLPWNTISISSAVFQGQILFTFLIYATVMSLVVFGSHPSISPHLFPKLFSPCSSISLTKCGFLSEILNSVAFDAYRSIYRF